MTPPDLATMLRELAEGGWKPVLYPETPSPTSGDVEAWVCYPMGAVRAWTSTRAPDPLGAVRQLWCWAREHPNTPSTPLPPRAPVMSTGWRPDAADPGAPASDFIATAKRLGYPAAGLVETIRAVRSLWSGRRMRGPA